MPGPYPKEAHPKKLSPLRRPLAPLTPAKLNQETPRLNLVDKKSKSLPSSTTGSDVTPGDEDIAKKLLQLCRSGNIIGVQNLLQQINKPPYLEHKARIINTQHICREGDRSSYRYTALQAAIANQQTDIALALIAHPAINVNLQDYDGSTALLLALETNQPIIAAALLKHKTINVNLPKIQNFGISNLPIIEAAKHGDLSKSTFNHLAKLSLWQLRQENPALYLGTLTRTYGNISFHNVYLHDKGAAYQAIIDNIAAKLPQVIIDPENNSSESNASVSDDDSDTSSSSNSSFSSNSDSEETPVSLLISLLQDSFGSHSSSSSSSRDSRSPSPDTIYSNTYHQSPSRDQASLRTLSRSPWDDSTRSPTLFRPSPLRSPMLIGTPSPLRSPMLTGTPSPLRSSPLTSTTSPARPSMPIGNPSSTMVFDLPRKDQQASVPCSDDEQPLSDDELHLSDDDFSNVSCMPSFQL